ncbi:MAG: redoxin domain-containing protein [Candidatus Nealsonbacteria bacterium]|nr:redoxin domain-containing protein [Candidatus Nealsonbacteria bacterium]
MFVKILALFSLLLVVGSLFIYFNQPQRLSETKTENEKLNFSQAVGKQAPDFVLQDINNKTVRLSDYRGKTVILFFNEGAMCYPACWDQIKSLAGDERFNADKVRAFSIVIDQKSEWDKIVSQLPEFSKAEILFDSDRKVSTAYDILALSSSMHPPSPMHPGGYPGHTYFIVDKNGIIRYTLDDPKMGLRNDVLLSEISKL